MARNSKFLTGMCVILAGVFIFGLMYLFVLRFKKGDIYPVYSSLRADPLGTKVFYESLKYMPGISVKRNYQPLKKLCKEKDTTIFYIGLMDPFSMQEDLVRDFESLAAAGNRLVISFFPVKEKNPKKAQTEKKQMGENKPSFTERWGFELAYGELAETPEIQASLNRDTDFQIETPVSWHTNRYFKNVKENWHVIYAWEEMPVLITRNWGKGAIVLCSDSYFLSNEAMYYERHPELLSWLAGGNTKLVFDETHFNIREAPGIMNLARKYRLDGLFAGIGVVTILFLWRNLSPFIPTYERDVIERRVSMAYGKTELAGFVSLLKRNISRRNILANCFEQWKRNMSHRMKEFGTRPQRMQAVIDASKKHEPGKHNPVEDYRIMSKILTERRKIN